MPILLKQYTLEITPEQFLNACSKYELVETDFLLNSVSIQKKMHPDDADTLEAGVLASNSGEAFEKTALMFPSNSIEASEIIFQITSKSMLVAKEVLELMPLFQKLERLRIKSLVKLPQLLPESPGDKIV
jgi:hypothetical protein